jgi:hypothetical protein
MTEPVADFGCDACYGAHPEAVWEHFGDGVDPGPTIVDDSHFIVRIVRCRLCSQAFVRIFTEFVDWAGGDDPQYITIMPVTDAEAAALADGVIPVLRAGKLGAGRRHLMSDWPSGHERRLAWATGEFLVSEGG